MYFQASDDPGDNHDAIHAQPGTGTMCLCSMDGDSEIIRAAPYLGMIAMP